MSLASNNEMSLFILPKSFDIFVDAYEGNNGTILFLSFPILEIELTSDGRTKFELSIFLSPDGDY